MAFYIALAIIVATGTIIFIVKSREFRKFLAGAFFVSSGIQFYLFLAKVSVPLLGTSFVLTPELNGIRSIIHFIFCILCFYFGFVKKPRSQGEMPIT